MLELQQTRRQIADYLDPRTRHEDRDMALRVAELEGLLSRSMRLYRRLQEAEAALQGAVFSGFADADNPFFAQADRIYRDLIPGLVDLAAMGQALADAGHPVAGLDEFIAMAEEADAMLGSRDVEPEIRPIEELVPLARPGNPDVARYGV